MTPPVKKYEIGSVRIEDKNHNGFFDPSVDQIKNERGKILRTNSDEVKKVMSEMGLQSFAGLRLSGVQKYFQSLQTAREGISYLSPETVKMALDHARDVAAKNGIFFNEKKAESFLTSSYKNAAERHLLQAERLVTEAQTSGNDPVEKAQTEIEKARAYAREGRLKFDEERASEVRKQAYQEGIKIAFEEAEHLWGGVRKHLLKIERYAEAGNIEIDHERKNLLEWYLSANWDLPKNSSCRLDLKNFAIHCGSSTPREVDAVVHYINLRSQLRRAAEDGDIESVRDHLMQTEEYVFGAKAWGIEFGFDMNKANEIFNQAIAASIEIDFKKAEKSATLGEVAQCVACLQRAQEKAGMWGFEFDFIRADLIMGTIVDNPWKKTGDHTQGTYL